MHDLARKGLQDNAVRQELNKTNALRSKLGAFLVTHLGLVRCLSWPFITRITANMPIACSVLIPNEFASLLLYLMARTLAAKLCGINLKLCGKANGNCEDTVI